MADELEPHERQWAALIGTIAAVLTYLVFVNRYRILLALAGGIVVWRAVIYLRRSGIWSMELPKR